NPKTTSTASACARRAASTLDRSPRSSAAAAIRTRPAARSLLRSTRCRRPSSRRLRKRSMDGLLIVDKPAGPTSHDVVARIRRVLGERRIGHTGTLDPAATGVLPLVLGRATRLARFLSSGDKIYEADIRLGVATDTYDADGASVGSAHTGPWPSADEISRAIERFRGQFLQQPPAFSAKKIAGRRSYRLARASKGSDGGRMGVGCGSDRGLGW